MFFSKASNERIITIDNYLLQTNRVAMWVSTSGSNIPDNAIRVSYEETSSNYCPGKVGRPLDLQTIESRTQKSLHSL